jgi:hypothetical protein
MSRLSTIYLRGRSGREYCFQVWPVGTRFKPFGGVYVMTRRLFDNPNFSSFASHTLVGIGMTEDFSTIAAGNGNESADCICVLAVAQPEDRAAVEQDLVDANLGGWKPLARLTAGASVAGAAEAAAQGTPAAS